MHKKRQTMAAIGKKNEGRSRVALFILLYWASSEASPLKQNRVRRAQRQVPYQHTLQSRARRPYDKFRRSSITESHVETTDSEGTRRRTLELEDYEEGRFWVYCSSPDKLNTNYDKQSKRSYVRKLYDQFVGEDASAHPGNQTNVTTEVDFNSTSSNATGESIVYTRSNETAYHTEFTPLRIRAVLAEDSDFLTTGERESLFHDMLSPALLSWSSALRVDPVAGNLTVDPHQLLNGEVCGPGNGLPSIVVPKQHTEEGIPNTDIIVYLSLGFMTVRNKTNATLSYPNNTSNVDEIDEDADEPENRGMRKDEEIENTPDSSSFTCSGEYLAAASFCSTDQYDRPTAALLHICVDETFFHLSKRNRNTMTLMHELGHALGFNSLSMAHFRRQDGSPITPRVNGTIPDTKIECTGPSENRTFANVALPSEEILKFREVRGGVRVAELVTPSILQVVRNQFDCQALTGAELESGEGLPLAMISEGHGCIGDHWERRLFSTDLMNAIIDAADYSSRISTLTLAYFADSGWYQVDLNYAKVAAGWGRGTGCNFVNDTCIGADGQVPPQNAPFFCNDIPTDHSRSFAEEIHGCTPDLSRKAICSIGKYDHALPHEFQYFQDTYGSDVGGSDAFMDYCPVYSGFDNGLCSNIQNAQYIKANQIETFGRRNSRCLLGDVGSNHKIALCLPIACVVEDQTLRINVDSVWHTCEKAGQVITSGTASVICPDPIRICPTFYCPFDCLGTGGICDYPSGECLCEYQNISDTSLSHSMIVAECGSLEEAMLGDTDEMPLNIPIIILKESDGKKQSILPPTDSPLSDYYVPTTQSLEENNLVPSLIMVIALAIGGALLLLLGFMWRERYMRRNVEVENTSPVDNNKDKMLATVLNGMRIYGGLAPQLNESLADTDEQLTESVASAMRSDMSDISFSGESQSGVSEVDSSLQGDVETENISQELVPDESRIIRRRRVGAEW
jgi:hypothetical protein